MDERFVELAEKAVEAERDNGVMVSGTRHRPA